MVSHTLYEKKLGKFQKKKLPVSLLNGLFSSKQVQREFPFQTFLHIVLDGALIGVLITVVLTSSVALHTQYLWTEAFTKLEKTRDLNRRILESTSILESYLLQNQKLSKSLVQTRAEDLIYIDRLSQQDKKILTNQTLTKKILARISSLPNKQGY